MRPIIFRQDGWGNGSIVPFTLWQSSPWLRSKMSESHGMPIIECLPTSLPITFQSSVSSDQTRRCLKPLGLSEILEETRKKDPLCDRFSQIGAYPVFRYTHISKIGWKMVEGITYLPIHISLMLIWIFQIQMMFHISQFSDPIRYILGALHPQRLQKQRLGIFQPSAPRRLQIW